MIFWIVQALGAVTLVLYAVSLLMKKKETLLGLQIGSNLSFFIQCLVKGTPTGAAITLLSTARGVVFFQYAKRGLKPSLAALLIFLALIFTAGWWTFEGPPSLFVIAATTIGLYAQWQDNMKVLRIGMIMSCSLWVGYHICRELYPNIVSELCNIVASVIGLWKYRERKNGA